MVACLNEVIYNNVKLQSYEEFMSLASEGDFSNLHVCTQDFHSDNSNTGKANTGKDAIFIEYEKAITKNNGNSCLMLRCEKAVKLDLPFQILDNYKIIVGYLNRRTVW